MLKTLKAQVEQILKTYPDTRDSDITLMIHIWKQYYGSRLVKFQGQTVFVALDNLYDLPREDNIKRIRAKFQNELGLYLPTKLEVALRRGIEEAKWREFMGYAPADPIFESGCNDANEEKRREKLFNKFERIDILFGRESTLDKAMIYYLDTCEKVEISGDQQIIINTTITDEDIKNHSGEFGRRQTGRGGI